MQRQNTKIFVSGKSQITGKINNSNAKIQLEPPNNGNLFQKQREKYI